MIATYQGVKRQEALDNSVATIKRLRAAGLSKEQIEVHPEYLASHALFAAFNESVKRNFQEFLEIEANPAKRWAIVAALEKEVPFSTGRESVRCKIERSIEDGMRAILDNRGKLVLVDANMRGFGSSHIGKIGMEYATFLSGKAS